MHRYSIGYSAEVAPKSPNLLHAKLSTVDREFFVLKIFHAKIFGSVKFS